MKAVFDHLTLYVSDFKKSSAFYRDLIIYLGGRVISNKEDHLGLKIGTAELWMRETEGRYKKNGFHRKKQVLTILLFGLVVPKKLTVLTEIIYGPAGS